MLLAIDVGNSNLTFGVFHKDVILYQWRIQTNRDKTSDEYGIELEQILYHFGIHRSMISDVIIGSVVPNLMHTLQMMCNRFLRQEPMIVGEGTRSGMHIRYDNPKEVGADRIVNAVGGFEIYGGPLIVIDVGTAITHDVITEEGEYLGGTIAPGIGISAEALFMRTAKLPKVELIDPPTAIGRTTVSSMQAGIAYGFIGLIDNITCHILKELSIQACEAKIIATGGFSRLLAEKSRYVQTIDKDLTLHGMRIIYERTKRVKNHE
ncbi:MAG: type III pantothenate kinase [Ndongobacter sp.]|nr:type III pantothenate kinase [Ndongobacter sp.]